MVEDLINQALEELNQQVFFDLEKFETYLETEDVQVEMMTHEEPAPGYVERAYRIMTDAGAYRAEIMAGFTEANEAEVRLTEFSKYTPTV